MIDWGKENYYVEFEKKGKKEDIFFHIQDKGSGNISSAINNIMIDNRYECQKKEDIGVVFEIVDSPKGQKAANVITLLDALSEDTELVSIRKMMRTDINVYFFLMEQLSEQFYNYFSGMICKDIWNYEEFEDYVQINGTIDYTKTSYNYTYKYPSKIVALPDYILGKPVTKIQCVHLLNTTAYECLNVKKFIIPTTITEIGSLSFVNCKEMVEINIQGQLKALPHGAFMYTPLEKINLPDQLTEIGEEAFGYTAIKSIDIPTSVKIIGKKAFLSCDALETVELPQDLQSIGEGAFYFCKSLNSITIPEGIKKIENYTFKYCEKLAKVDLPYGLEVIGEDAFYGCRGLQDITIPNTVKVLEKKCFYLCGGMLSIPKTVTEIQEDAWEDDNVVEVAPGSQAERFCISREYPYKYADSNVIDLKAERITRTTKEAVSRLTRTYYGQIVGEVISVEGHFRNVGNSYNGYPSFEAVIQTEGGRKYTLYFGGPFHNEGRKLKSGHYKSAFYHEACTKITKGKIVVIPASAATSSYIKICDCASHVAYSYEQNQVRQFVDYQVFNPLI